MKQLLTYFLLIPFLLAGSDFSETRTLNLSAGGIKKLSIDCGSGFLKVNGKAGLQAIEVTAEIVSQYESTNRIKKLIKDHLILTLERRGSTAHLTSKFEGVRSFFSGHGDIQINLTVEIPEIMNLDIHDGSGTTDIANVTGKLKLDDGSGETNIENVQGDVDIEDGSGSLTIKKIAGNVEIEDGSGSIGINDVSGDVVVDDGSGSITIRNVGQDVIIHESGSGGVSISDVRGKIFRYDED